MRTLAAVMALFGAAAMFAAPRSRSVRPIAEGIYSASVVDATNGKPVIEAEVTSGTRTVKTDARGAFSIVVEMGRPVALVIHRSGYEDAPLTVTLPASTGGTVISPTPPQPAPAPQPVAPITLMPKAPVLMKTTDGLTVPLDADTVQFAYIIPFSSPATSNAASFCRLDGTAYTPDRSEFSRIVGPAVLTSNAACCKLGNSLAVNVEMKSGEKEKVIFSDSCFGYDVVLTGRDRVSAQYVYARFTEIASIDFP
jgi:hypothetical protein